MRTLIACLSLGCALGCPSSDEPGPPGGGATLSLEATPRTLVLRTGQRHRLALMLKDDRAAPAAGVLLRFAIVSERPDLGRGATLSVSEAVSDAGGEVNLEVQAGLPTAFSVRVSSTRTAALEIPVFVSAGSRADLTLVPTALGAPAGAIASVAVHVYDNSACARLGPPGQEPAPGSLRPPQRVAPEQGALFTNLRTDQAHAAIGLGHDAEGALVAWGCIDVPGTQLLDATSARATLPVVWLPWQVQGRYTLTSNWAFAARPPAVEALVKNWQALSACPADPAQQWLDCVLDGLADGADDALDCRPSGSENGAVFLAIQARRGLVSQDEPPTGCRGPLDPEGRPALDARVRAGFRAEAAVRIAALPSLAHALDTMWSGFSIRSRLDLAPSDRPAGGYLAHHRLELLHVRSGVSTAPVELLLRDLGLPALQARHVETTWSSRALILGPHAFTLKLGTALRHAFTVGVLREGGLATDIAELVLAIEAGFESDAGGTPETGCPGLDALVCSEAGLARGCLGEACARAAGAWTSLLSDGFAALDGDDRDFFLDGDGVAHSADGTRRVSTLGGTNQSPTGRWNTILRTRSGNHGLTGTWSARRAEPE